MFQWLGHECLRYERWRLPSSLLYDEISHASLNLRFRYYHRWAIGYYLACHLGLFLLGNKTNAMNSSTVGRLQKLNRSPTVSMEPRMLWPSVAKTGVSSCDVYGSMEANRHFHSFHFHDIRMVVIGIRWRGSPTPLTICVSKMYVLGLCYTDVNRILNGLTFMWLSWK